MVLFLLEADNIYADTVLNNTVIIGIKQIPPGMITGFHDFVHDIFQRISVSRVGQPFDILENKYLGLSLVKQEKSIIPQLSSGILESEVATGNRPTLTGHPSCKKIMIRQPLQFGYITKI